MNQTAIARELGVTQATWSKYEAGEIDMPPKKAQALVRLALGHKLLIDLNHVYEDIPLPPAPAQAAQAGG